MALIKELEIKLAKHLSEQSFSHSIRTMDTATMIAKRYDCDPEKTALAALLHDYAKDFSDGELLEESKNLGFKIISIEEKNPYLLHARIGAALVEKDLGITDPLILSAIMKHTYGDVVMSDLDKIIYLADVVEPGRSYEGVADIRKIVFDDLNNAFKEAYLGQLMFVFKKRAFVHPVSVAVWNQILETSNNGSFHRRKI